MDRVKCVIGAEMALSQQSRPLLQSTTQDMMEFNNTGWDAFEHLIKITEQLHRLTEAHNLLAANHEQLIKKVELCQQQILVLRNLQLPPQ